MVKLYDVLKSSYEKPDEQQKRMKEHGYERDSSLSNDNEQVYFNPAEKKMIFNVAGTHNLKDWGTNAALAAGQLKSTKRYKDAHKKIRDAKTKYGDTETVVTGHSLGHAIASGISSKNDKVITYDGAYAIGQKTRGNTTHYRTKGDAVSIMGSGAKHTVNLENKNMPTNNNIYNALKAHKVENISDKNIFI
jgi:hypothetical protein